jgi:hypothetical protein
MRKINVDIKELIDIIFAGREGDLYDYLYDYLKNDLKITNEDIKEYAKYYRTQEAKKNGYEEEDYESAMDFAEDW